MKQKGSATSSGKGMDYATSARLFVTKAAIREELIARTWALPDRLAELSAP